MSDRIFQQESNDWDTVVLKFQTHLHALYPVVSRLNGRKLRFSEMNLSPIATYRGWTK
jgi:hypothetical protein